MMSLRWGLALGAAFLALLTWFSSARNGQLPGRASPGSAVRELSDPVQQRRPGRYRPRQPIDTAGFITVNQLIQWGPDATLEDIRDAWSSAPERTLQKLDQQLKGVNDPRAELSLLVPRIELLIYLGRVQEAYQNLCQIRSLAEHDGEMASRILYTVIYMQGLTALRQGEDENCILCRGESSCILPISAAAQHTRPEGSRRAIQHFTEYLDHFPDDSGVRWLLNLAHMTLGEYPAQVNPRYVLDLSPLTHETASIGRFRDLGAAVGVNQFSQAGGTILDDLDNDGSLDLATTSFDPQQSLTILLNTRAGRFEDRSEVAGVSDQLGGLNCVQADFDQDGFTDLLILRGAWFMNPIRQSLLRNNGDGTFTDVTADAGLAEPANSIAAGWGDYDNDGNLDLFLACERQPSRLYRGQGDGTFADCRESAQLTLRQQDCKGVAWIDVNNDGYQDLFLNYLLPIPGAQLFLNDRDGTFHDATEEQGISGPVAGFSCWSWDYDNDGWLDLFATTYDLSLPDAVAELLGSRHGRSQNRLYRNRGGMGFEDCARDAGVDQILGTMGSNFADFDNDGFLDFYLGTGSPNLEMLIPNRMLRNQTGVKFIDITASSGTGNLQKGHGVGCGDWDRDGDVDLFIQMGGATIGDQYHNILFQNPGQGNHWLTLRLHGTQSNRSALGARVRLVTAGEAPREIHRHITTGSSFGANPLEQTIGLGTADRVALLEIHWPASGERQTFHDLAVDQRILIRERSDAALSRIQP